MPKLRSPFGTPKMGRGPKPAREARARAMSVVQRSDRVRPVVVGGGPTEAERRQAATLADAAARRVARSVNVAGQLAHRKRLQAEDDRALGRGRNRIERPRRGR